MTSTPITTELRDAFVSVHADTETSAAWLTFEGETFYNLCDAIDSIHANLERENASLKAELDRLMGEQECEQPTPADGITDELRTWAKGSTLSSWTAEHLTAIADRIDAKHEEAIQQVLMGEGGVPATDENMAELGWVRLPKDADGECIHIGDVMEWCNGTFTVHELKLTEDGWQTWDSEHGYTVHDDECICHRHPDTWERIIEDAIIYAVSDIKGDRARFDALVARCRALAGDAS